MAKNFSKTVIVSPSAYSQFLSGTDFFLGPSKEILLIGSDNKDIRDYLKIIHANFIPNKVILSKNSENSGSISHVAGFTKSYQALDGETLAYVCENFSCKLPVSSAMDLLNILST